MVCLALIIMMIIEIVYEDVNDYIVSAYWNILSLIVTIVLTISLCRIQNFMVSQDMADIGIYADKKLIKLHSGTFMFGTFVYFLTYIISTVQKPYDDNVEDMDRYLKLSISNAYLSVAGSFPWFIIACLMMWIYSHYGKPLEDDECTLI